MRPAQSQAYGGSATMVAVVFPSSCRAIRWTCYLRSWRRPTRPVDQTRNDLQPRQPQPRRHRDHRGLLGIRQAKRLEREREGSLTGPETSGREHNKVTDYV